MSDPSQDVLQIAWRSTLERIDELMQLGLLEHLRYTRLSNLCDGILEIKVLTSSSYEYLTRDSVKNHLLIIAKSIFEKNNLILNDIRFLQSFTGIKE